MARKRHRSYFEPWVPAKDKSWESTYKFGPPKHGETPEDVAQNVADWEAKRAAAEANADWVVWGSKMVEPGIVKSFGCDARVADENGVIVVVRRKLYLADGSPTQEHICKRIAECVNAMAGVGDPVKFVDDVRSLLHEYAKGECAEDPRTDSRVISILSRCIPPEQQENVHETED